MLSSVSRRVLLSMICFTKHLPPGKKHLHLRVQNCRKHLSTQLMPRPMSTETSMSGQLLRDLLSPHIPLTLQLPGCEIHTCGPLSLGAFRGVPPVHAGPCTLRRENREAHLHEGVFVVHTERIRIRNVLITVRGNKDQPLLSTSPPKLSGKNAWPWRYS